MNQKKDTDPKDTRQKDRKKTGLSELRGLIYHNSFVLALSFVVALVGWFVMAAGSDKNRTYVIYDVPIQVTLSSQAEADGLRVFNMSYNTVDIEVSGNSMITSRLTAEDFEVTASLNPTSVKLTGNTTQRYTSTVRPAKRSSISDYEIVSVSPAEVVMEFDRYKEVTKTIETTDIAFSAGTGFFPGTPSLSEDKVSISGPESAVNKISRAAVAYVVENPLRANETLSCPVRVYDQDNQEIADTAGQYLSLDVDTVEVTIPVTPKKTVPLSVTTAHQPMGFSESRINIEPKEIDITGSSETLANITEIRLDTVVDFAELDVNQRAAVFNIEIPVPSGTRNITNTGSNSVSQAKVTINLNGYKQAVVTVPESNIQIINAPSGAVESYLSTRTMEVTLAGPEAQVAKLTGDSVMVQVDMSNIEGRAGIVDVPAMVTITGSAGEACWAIGSYTMAVTMQNTAGSSSASSRQNAAAPASN